MADLVKMGVNAMAGGGGSRGNGGGGSQVMDLVNMGANLMGAVGGAGNGRQDSLQSKGFVSEIQETFGNIDFDI